MKGKASLELLLDRCLREVADGADLEQCLNRYPEWRAELEPVLRGAVRLQRGPRVEPSEDLTNRVWARVRRGIEEERRAGVTKRGLARLYRRERPRDWSQPPRRYSMSGIAAAVALIITLMGGSGMVYASQDALPGQTLYQVKEIMESARLQLSASEQARLQLRLELAGEKLTEAERASAHGGGVGAAVALEAYSSHLSRAQEVAEAFRGTPEEAQVRARLQESLQEHLALLESLQERLQNRGEAGEALHRAMENIHRLQERWQERHGQGGEEPETTGLSGIGTEGSESPRATEPAQHREQGRYEEGQGQPNREQNREASGGEATPPVAGAQPSTEAPSPQPTTEPGREQEAAGGTGGAEPDWTQDRQQEQAGDQQQDRQQEQDQDGNQQQQQDQQQNQTQDQQQDRAQEQEGVSQQDQQQEQQQSRSQDQQQAQIGAPSDSGSDGDSGQQQSDSAGGEAAGGGRP